MLNIYTAKNVEVPKQLWLWSTSENMKSDTQWYIVIHKQECYGERVGFDTISKIKLKTTDFHLTCFVPSWQATCNRAYFYRKAKSHIKH